MKEHCGGTPETAFIPINHWSEESFEVHPVFHPDPAASDTLADVLRETVESGGDVEGVAMKWLAPGIAELQIETIRRLLAIICEAKNPRLVVDQLKWAFDISHNVDGLEIGDLAARHGIRKQAFQQGAKKIRLALAPEHALSARSESSRARMRARNFRRIKHEV